MDIRAKIVLIGEEKTSKKGNKYRAVTVQSNGNALSINCIGNVSEGFKNGLDYDFLNVKEGEYNGNKTLTYYFPRPGGSGIGGKKSDPTSYNRQTAARATAQILQGHNIDEWQRFGEIYDYVLAKINGQEPKLPAKETDDEHIPF